MMARDNGADDEYSDDGNYSDEYEDDFEAGVESPKNAISPHQQPWLGPGSPYDLGAVDFSPPSAGLGSRSSVESAGTVLHGTRDHGHGSHTRPTRRARAFAKCV